MTDHEMDLKRLKAMESIAASLKSIDFYLKCLANSKDEEIRILSATGSDNPPECPESR